MGGEAASPGERPYTTFRDAILKLPAIRETQARSCGSSVFPLGFIMSHT